MYWIIIGITNGNNQQCLAENEMVVCSFRHKNANTSYGRSLTQVSFTTSCRVIIRRTFLAISISNWVDVNQKWTFLDASDWHKTYQTLKKTVGQFCHKDSSYCHQQQWCYHCERQWIIIHHQFLFGQWHNLSQKELPQTVGWKSSGKFVHINRRCHYVGNFQWSMGWNTLGHF